MRRTPETGLPLAPRWRMSSCRAQCTSCGRRPTAARDGSWRLATIDTAANIRSWFAPLGPVVVFGPNNFPFAFGSASGGDFAAAMAAGNPVIAKANSSHPATTRLLAEEAHAAVMQTGCPPAPCSCSIALAHADGERLVGDPRVGATGYTGSRRAGLALKAAADRAGKPIYLELSSVNPVVILPGALATRGESIAEEFAASCLLGTGQFCTNPGLVLVLAGPDSEAFIATVADRFAAAPVGTLLSGRVQDSLEASIADAVAGAERLAVARAIATGRRVLLPNTLLRISGRPVPGDSRRFQIEAFGNASLVVVAEDFDQFCRRPRCLEGNLTGSIYSDPVGPDDDALRSKWLR